MEKTSHICPWWIAYSFETPLRYLTQSPNKILKPFLKEGMTFLDLGSGMGFFSINAAKIVGDEGRVHSVDVQSKMLEILYNNAKKNKVENIVQTHLCEPNIVDIEVKADFALAMWMVHEVPDVRLFFEQVKKLLNPGATLLVIEPTFIHVSKKTVLEEIEIAKSVGFEFVKDYGCDFFNTGFLLKNLV